MTSSTTDSTLDRRIRQLVGEAADCAPSNFDLTDLDAKRPPSTKRCSRPLGLSAAAALLLVVSLLVWASTRPTNSRIDAVVDNEQAESATPIGEPVFMLRHSDTDLRLDWQVFEGVDRETIRLGPGHYPFSVLPGDSGNVAIHGHRVVFDSPLHRLNEVEPGDTFTLESTEGVFDYEVVASETGEGFAIVESDDVSLLDSDGSAVLTITSYHPKYTSDRQRIVVRAELVGEPAGTPIVFDAPISEIP